MTLTARSLLKLLIKYLSKAADGKLIVGKVDKKERRRNPTAPFITSTMQQEAIRKLRFSAQRAMRIAQQLYEGIDLGSGPSWSNHLHAY